MDTLDSFLSKNWSVENDVRECWSHFSPEEKARIQIRLDDMFRDGLPFELIHDRIHYIYVFNFLVQIEILGTKILLESAKAYESPKVAHQLREHIMDEMFHSLVFLKTLYLLCAPFALPPNLNCEIKEFCDFIRNQDHKTASLLLFFIGESWIEVLFRCLYECNIAPKVFGTIMEDESRHAAQGDLHHLSLTDKFKSFKQIRVFEGILSRMSFPQSKTSMPRLTTSIQKLLGPEGSISYFQLLIHEHVKQLKKVGLKPHKCWLQSAYFLMTLNETMNQYFNYNQIELSLHRRTYFQTFENRTAPIVQGQFNIDVTALDYFEKDSRYKLNLLLLQALSKVMSETDYFRHFYNEKKLYCCNHSIINFVVSLPGCKDQLGLVLLRDCHQLTLRELGGKLRRIIQTMVYCYNRREQLEEDHPKLKFEMLSHDENYLNTVYANPYSSAFASYLGINVTNVGHWGWLQGKNADPIEASPSTMVMMAVQKQQIWNKNKKAFVETDVLPISFSTDHRMNDPNRPIPQLLNDAFQQVLERDSHTNVILEDKNTEIGFKEFQEKMEAFIAFDPNIAHKLMFILQECWPDGMDLSTLLDLNGFKSVINFEEAVESF